MKVFLGATTAAFLVFPQIALSETFIYEGPVPNTRKLVEDMPKGALMGLDWTDEDGNVIPGPRYGNSRVLGTITDPEVAYGEMGQLVVDIPETVTNPEGEDVGVFDFIQRVYVPGHLLDTYLDFIASVEPDAAPIMAVAGPGETADEDDAFSSLRVNAIEDLGGGDYMLYAFDDYVDLALGAGAPVWIPDLFADTDGSGSWGAGDALYAAVNLVDYLAAPLSDYAFGDTFEIVDGVSAALPGMVFGTAPITRDPLDPSGWLNSSPFTGTAGVAAQHSIVDTPAPAAAGLLAAALAGLGALRRRVG